MESLQELAIAIDNGQINMNIMNNSSFRIFPWVNKTSKWKEMIGHCVKYLLFNHMESDIK